MKRLQLRPGQTWHDAIDDAADCPVRTAIVLLTYTVYSRQTAVGDLFGCVTEALELLDDRDTLGGWFWKFGLPPTVEHLRWLARCIALDRGYLLL